MTVAEALKQNPRHHCPADIIAALEVVLVDYYGFDGKVHSGQVVIHRALVPDIRGAFELLLNDEFPLQSVTPISDSRFLWDDDISTSLNNTSAFNYRYIRDSTIMSHHSRGRAIDFNPKLNPYFPEGKVFPQSATYDPSVPGTILASSRLVAYFESLGWRWGGNWDEDLDYQHFEKLN